MATTAKVQGADNEGRSFVSDLSPAVVERTIRLWAGSVLMIFVTMHLLNHALGIFGVEVMGAAQEWRVAIWRSWPGTILLYGALGLHMLLALKRAVSRRTWRMPAVEALQIVLGLAIPILLARHVVGTRVMASLAGADDSYVNVLRYLWPDNALWQSVALLVAWAHGVVGLHFVLRTRDWFERWRSTFYVVAFALPLLALAGFVAGGRDAHLQDVPPEAWTPAQNAVYEAGQQYARYGVWAILALPALLIVMRELVRRLRPSVTVRYVGHGATRNPTGLTLLEMSRLNQIPHPSVCGGRGRCSTCRVLVLSDTDMLPPPNALERKLLTRIKAPKRVRLACQIRPDSELNVRILLPVDAKGRGLDWEEEALKWGTERHVAVLFADIRGFSTLARSQLPADLVVLLNRVIEDMTQAVASRGGRTALVLTDGIMGVFGTETSLRNASRSAIEAAQDILRAAETINRELGGAIPQPLRIGVGIHCGHTVLARIGDAEQGYSMSVIGQTVVIASRLEEATKELAADCIVSEETIADAGLKSAKAGTMHTLNFRNGEAPVPVRAFADADDVKALVG